MTKQPFRLLALATVAAAVAVAAVPFPAASQNSSQTSGQRSSHGRPPRAERKPNPAGPQRIGRWEDWQAATHQEGGQLVCYAFTRASASTPAVPGRGDVVLTVTERAGGRDAVALTAGFAYPANAEVGMSSEGVTLPFYTAGRSAFAKDGRAAVAMFNRGRSAQARSPGPRGQAVTDTFSLRGFGQAYAAVQKACPAK